MRSKSTYVVALFLFLSFISRAHAQEEATSGPVFQILGHVGFGYAHNPDMSDWTKNLGDNLASDLNTIVGGNDFKAKPENAGFEISADAEARLFFGVFGFGASTGYHSVSSKSEVSSKVWSDKATYSAKLNVIPVTGTVYLQLSASPNNLVVLGAGAGYYMATLKTESVDKVSIGADFNESYTFKNNAIGYHCKLEYDHIFANQVTVYCGVIGKYVQFNEFTGDGVTVINSDGSKLAAGLTGVQVYFGAGYSI
jgi:hypothetical protein